MKEDYRAIIIAGIFWLICLLFGYYAINTITPPVLLDSPATVAGHAGRIIYKTDTIFSGWTIYKGKPGYLIITKETELK